MDVLSPDLLWIDGRCYRLPVLDSTYSSNSSMNLRDCDLEADLENTYRCEAEDEGNEDMTTIPEITVLPGNRHSMIISVPRSFLPFIIGAKGATIKRISKDTFCRIKTSNFSDEKNVTITGNNKNNVILAWKSISFIINSSRKKLAVTHFLSIPLNCDKIKENFLKFKEEVLLVCRDRGVCEEIFQQPSKLHLTITVLILTDEKERKMAEEKLIEVGNKIVRPILETKKPCILEVKGLECMNDDPAEVRVLYANVRVKNDETLLQELCNKVRIAFSELQFSKDKGEDVKIHMTVLNTSNLLEENYEWNDSKGKLKTADIKTFNATNILKNFKDFDFGEQELTSINLSMRFTQDESGYYKNTAKIEI